MKKINWTTVIIFGVVVLLFFVVGVSLLGGGWYGGWGRMGPDMMGPGMMGGRGFYPLGWIGMLFMWLIPVGFVVLIILGIVWLLRAIGTTGGSTSSSINCPNCGRITQTDWRNCPYCGQVLH